jgi:regulatory protein
MITGLVTKGAGGERIAVYLDGRHAFDVSAAIASQAELHKDEFLSDEQQVALLQRDEPYRARESALSMLARRDLCSGEVASRLLARGISESVVADTTTWLQERGYVDDLRFAADYAADRTKAGWGRRRIAAELLRKGLAREIVTGEALDGLLGERGAADGVGQIVTLVRRRFAGQLHSDPEGARRRINGYLARRGHDWETISSVLRALKQGDDSAHVEFRPEP